MSSTLPDDALPSYSSASSEQPKNSFSTLQTTLSVATTTMSSSPSVPSSSAVPSTSANASSTSSASSATTAASSSRDQSTTSTPESSVQPTTPALTTTQSSSSLTTSEFTTTASSSPISSTSSAFNTPSSITSPPPLSSPSTSQTTSPIETDMPLYEFVLVALEHGLLNDIDRTTVLESTTIFLTSTNSQGQVVTSVPPVVTEVITTTGSSGIATTVTQAIINPTLASNNSTTGGSSFFTDTGAVVGVFVVVGLATASIMMWILFAIRHRQRMRRIEQDTAIEAAVAAAGFNRAPLDDDDDDDEVGSPISSNVRRQLSSGVGQRISLLGSLPTSAGLSDVPDDPAKDGPDSHPGFSVERRASDHPEGYIPTRTMSPLPHVDDIGSSRDRKSSYGHTPTYSAGSFEPLLANYARNMADQDTSAVELPRNRSPRRLGSGLGPGGYSSNGSPEEASRPSLKRQNSSDSSVLRDDDAYAHHVLTVRNVPDNQSQHST